MKLKITAVKLDFESGIHLGNREGGLEGTDNFVHSDTLYSAFFNGFRLLFGQENLKQKLQLFMENNPPFLISSAFPYWNGNYFLPTPKNQIPGDKKAKKIMYLDSLSWSSLIRGKPLVEILDRPSTRTIPLTSDISGYQGQNEPWQMIDAPRVGLDRRSNHPGERYFHCGEVYYGENSGLYFLVMFYDQSFRESFYAVWRLLADEGLGGDRTVGKGHFRYPSTEEFLLDLPDQANGSIVLSLYYPSESERVGFQEGYYDLLERQGFVYSPDGRSLRRKTLSMFAEGSMFPIFPKRIGEMVDVTPSAFKTHPVYRSGMYFGVPCII